jgi:hypothetical protein
VNDFDGMSDELLLARGKYATARALHLDALKRIQILCGGLGATSAQILRAVQPDNDGVHDEQIVSDLLDACRTAVDSIQVCAGNIRHLAELRAALKPAAWPK